MDIRYCRPVSELKSMEELDLPESILGLLDVVDMRHIAIEYRKYSFENIRYKFEFYLADKFYEWVKSAPVEEGGEDLISDLFKYGTVVKKLLYGDAPSSSESGNDLLVGILRSMLEDGCDGWINTEEWVKSAPQIVKGFLNYVKESTEKTLPWDLSLEYAIADGYMDYCNDLTDEDIDTILWNALGKAGFIRWSKDFPTENIPTDRYETYRGGPYLHSMYEPDPIWSVDGVAVRYSMDYSFTKDDDGNTWLELQEPYESQWFCNGVPIAEDKVPAYIRY